MTERILTGDPASLPTMLKAALPALPGANLIPGVAKRPGPLPDLTLGRDDVTVSRSHVAAYAEVCGFEPSEHLPLTYPHLLSFPLQMAIMTDASFPFPAMGTVHLRNSITAHRPLGYDERLSVRVRPVDLRPHPKGRLFDLVTQIGAEGETVWESVSSYLRLGHGDPDAGVPESLPVTPGTEIVWQLPGNLGRRYASVSGDHNPIHLYPLTAKALGFRRQIAHGMWSKARCVAALANRLPEHVTVEVEFKKPVFLPGAVAFGSRVDADGAAFSLTSPRTGAPHLVGRAR